MAEILLERVTRTYRGGVTAVRDLDLRIADGELLVLAGPSGCGKTTTLRLIAGLERPTAGTVSLGGKDVGSLRPRARDVAMVFQSDTLYPHMTTRRNLGFASRLRGVASDEIARRVQEVAGRLGLEPLLERKPGELSGGERQRVALGRVMVRRPSCALLDEPLAHLDANTRHALRSELRRLHDHTGTTTVHVTHDQEEAMALAGRLAVLTAGTLQQVGPPRDLYERPANRLVAGFLGRPPMNFLEGGLEKTAGGVVFVGAGVRLTVTLDARAANGVERVVLGLRPTDLHVAREGESVAIELQVDDMEALGDRVDLVGRPPAGGPTLVARLDRPDARAAGTTVGLTIAPERIHLFEPGANGARIA